MTLGIQVDTHLDARPEALFGFLEKLEFQLVLFLPTQRSFRLWYRILQQRRIAYGSTIEYKAEHFE